jgi:DNA-binding NtrC family response regulator
MPAVRPPAGQQPAAAMLPLNDMLLQHYLYNFEKQLLTTALDDCANILGFAAERLEMNEQDLKRKMETFQLESF